MIRVILLILLLLTGCSDRDRSTSDDVNQEHIEQPTDEKADEAESSVEPDEDGDVDSGIFRPGIANTLKFVGWGILILLVVVSVLGLSLMIKRDRDRISKLERKLNRKNIEFKEKRRDLRKCERDYRSLEDHLNKKDKRIKLLEESNSQLRSKVNEIDSDSPIGGSSGDGEDEQGKEKVVVNEPMANIPKAELFFEIPNRQGKFKHENGIKTFKKRRLYKITYKKNESEGVIEFVSSKYDGLAINHKDSMIRPACNIIEENENNPSSVNQISPGKVKRVGDEWIIESKIKVEIS